MYVRFGRFLEFDQMQHVVPNVSTKDDTYEIKGKAMIVQRRQTIESELLLLVVQRPYHTMVRCCLLERTKNFEKRPCAKDDARLVRFDRTPKKKKKEGTVIENLSFPKRLYNLVQISFRIRIPFFDSDSLSFFVSFVSFFFSLLHVNRLKCKSQ